jgi:hypothetical protein
VARRARPRGDPARLRGRRSGRDALDLRESDPYAGRGAPDTSNDADGIYGQSGGTTVVAVTPGEAYRGSVTLGVQRT